MRSSAKNPVNKDIDSLLKPQAEINPVSSTKNETVKTTTNLAE
jgi:hypothetical protein